MTVIPTGSWLSLPLAAQSVSRKSAPSVTRCLPLSLQGNILFYDYEYILMGLFFYIIDILGWFIPNKVFKWPWSQLAADCRFHWPLNQTAKSAPCLTRSLLPRNSNIFIPLATVEGEQNTQICHKSMVPIVNCCQAATGRSHDLSVAAAASHSTNQPLRGAASITRSLLLQGNTLFYYCEYIHMSLFFIWVYSFRWVYPN